MSSSHTPEKQPETDPPLSSEMLEGIKKAVSTTSRLESTPSTPRITFKLVREIGRDADPPLANPITLAMPPGGQLLVLERPAPDLFRLRRFLPTGEPDGEARQFDAGSGDTCLTGPAGLAVDSQHQVYIADPVAGCVKKFSPDGRWLETYRCGGPDNNPLDGPADVDVDESGNLYVADTNNNRIVQLLPDGQPGWTLQEFQTGSGDCDELYEPHSVCIGRDASITVADTNQNRVLRFDAQRRLIASIAGENLFEFPSEVRISRDGATIYAADCGNLRVRRFDAAGNVTGTVCVTHGNATQQVIGGGDIDIDEHGHVVMINPVRQSVIVLEFVEP